MKDAKVIFRAKNFYGDILGERHFNVSFETYDGIVHFLQAEMTRTRVLGRERFPDIDFFVDYIMPDLADDEEPHVYLD